MKNFYRLDRVKMAEPDQFGPDGPQVGTKGVVVQRSVDPEGEFWYSVIFEGHHGNYWVTEDMIDG